MSSIFLRAVVDLHVIEDQGALAPSSIHFEDVSGEDLSTPAVYILTLNLDVSAQKEHFSAHIDSILGFSGCSFTVVIVIERLIECDQASSI